jgi:hypothetical protein
LLAAQNPPIFRTWSRGAQSEGRKKLPYSLRFRTLPPVSDQFPDEHFLSDRKQ